MFNYYGIIKSPRSCMNKSAKNSLNVIIRSATEGYEINMRYRGRIRIYTNAYKIVAVIALAVMALSFAACLKYYNMIRPEFTYYGNDDVSGWATILSGFGYMIGVFGKVLLYIMAIICVIAAVYWTIGLLFNHLLRKKMDQEASPKGMGIALGVWTIIPGVLSLNGLISVIANKTAELKICITGGLLSALFIGAGIFLLITVCHENIKTDENLSVGEMKTTGLFRKNKSDPWFEIKKDDVIALVEKRKDCFPWGGRPEEKYQCLIFREDGAVCMTVDEFFKIDEDTYKCLRPYTTILCNSFEDYNNLTEEEFASKAYNAWCTGAR